MMEITRPTFIVDKEICLSNIEKMVQKARRHELHFRPHFKTHQSAEIGDWFRIFGVKSITVSSVLMAEYFASNGWDDITIAFPLNILEMNNINRIAAKINLNVLVENKESANFLKNETINPLGVYLKIDTGLNRTGIEPYRTELMDSIIDMLSTNKKITFKGFLTHNGLTYFAASSNEIVSYHADSLLKLKTIKQRYLTSFPDIEISIGDTPSCAICTDFTGVDEIRPGNFVFYDLMQQSLGVCKFEDIAVKMVCPIVAKHFSRNEVIIYGGAIHLSKESLQNINGQQIFGRIVINYKGEKKLLSEQNYVSRLSQEHGILKVSEENFQFFKVGDLVEIIPVHSCLTANLAMEYLTTSKERIDMLGKKF